MDPRRRSLTLGLCCALALSSCVAPARTLKPYVADAVTTAQQTLSAVQTALLGASAGTRGKAHSNYLSALLGDAEDTASAVQANFNSEQPPGPQADRIRSQLDKILQEASSVLTALRIHARRGQLDRLDQIAAPLKKVSKDLNDFIGANE